MRLNPMIMSEAVKLPKALRDFVDTAEWTFAKTMPEWPHEYIVRDRVDEDLFEALVHHIRAHGSTSVTMRIQRGPFTDNWLEHFMGLMTFLLNGGNACRI